MKKLTGFNPNFITKTYFPDFVNNPDKINYGQCFMWAYLAHETFSGVELWDTGVHAFVKYRGKFYDSETPEGVNDLEDLPANTRRTFCPCASCKAPARKYKRHSFQTEWHNQTHRFQVSWYEMDQWVDKVLKDSRQ